MSEVENTNQAARTAIQKIAGTYRLSIVRMMFCEVKSVNKQERTCTVIPISDKSNAEIEDVSLSIDRNDGEIKIPAIGSTVGVAFSSELDPFVFAWSDISEIALKGGNFYGLVKVKDLTDKINTLERDLNALKNILSSWVPVPSDGGAALKTAAATWYGQTLTETQQSEIENTKITHGDK